MKRADTLREGLDRLFDAGKGPRLSLVDGPGEVVAKRHTLLIASQFSAISCAVHAAPSSLNVPGLCATL